jgi:hypothetical protein
VRATCALAAFAVDVPGARITRFAEDEGGPGPATIIGGGVL